MLPFLFQVVRWEAYVDHAWRHFDSESRKRAEKAYLELTRIGVWSLGESSICIAPFGCTALEHPLKGP